LYYLGMWHLLQTQPILPHTSVRPTTVAGAVLSKV
jgi:hypothetical protein